MARAKRAATRAEGSTGGERPGKAGTRLRDARGVRLALWLALAAVLSLVTLVVLRVALAALFEGLFRAWGIDAGNVYRAPGWARWIYAWHGAAITAMCAAALLGISEALRRLRRLDRERMRWKGLSAPAKHYGAGTALAVGPAALFLMTDSLRLYWPLSAPRLSGALIPLWLLGLFSVVAEEWLIHGAVYEGILEAGGAPWATGVACAAFFLMNRGYGGNALCAVNVLLLGLYACRLYHRRGLWAAALFRWGWGFAAAFLLGSGGGESAVYRLYGVSEALLTGGDAGAVNGLCLTLCLLAMLAFAERKALMGLRAARLAGRAKKAHASKT